MKLTEYRNNITGERGIFAAPANNDQEVTDLMNAKNSGRFVNLRKLPARYKTMVVVDNAGDVGTVSKRDFLAHHEVIG